MVIFILKTPDTFLITHRFSLDEVNQAFAAMRDKPEGFIKGVVVP
jgi:threonine dehydrogenase-like Zn-dependent dehydrogenase